MYACSVAIYVVMVKSLTSKFAEFDDIIMKKKCACISKVSFRKNVEFR